MMGILFACIAIVSWGIGDFLIQRSTRKFGNLFALFYITAFSSIVLFPFVLKDLKPIFLSQDGLSILLLASFALLVASLLNFEALRIGKISVIEPIYAFEVPVATALAAVFIHERLNPLQYLLLGSILVGVVLVSAKSRQSLRVRLEKGVVVAMLATMSLGAVNFLFGYGVRETNPFVINWFTSLLIAIVCGSALVWQSRFGEMIREVRRSASLILNVSFFDNLAWVAFAASMLYIPVGVATGISESYIVVAVILGIIFNHERLKRHQWIGLVLCIVSAVLLALITDK